MLALECSSIRDLENTLVDFRCDNKSLRFTSRHARSINNLSIKNPESTGLSISMESLNSSTDRTNINGFLAHRDPEVWRPLMGPVDQ